MDRLGAHLRAPDVDLDIAREARGVSRSVLAAEASDLLRVRTLTPHEISAHRGFHNQAVEGVERLRSGFSCSALDDVFTTWNDDHKVLEATRLQPFDDDEAAEVRAGYRQAYHEAKREHACAARAASRLGLGVHPQENGDSVEVGTDQEIGTTTVVTRQHSGAVKAVRFDAYEPNAVEVRMRHADGAERVLSHHDLRVTVHERAPLGGRSETITTWDLDGDGTPRRERR